MTGITKGEDLPEPLPGDKDFYVTIDDEHLLQPKFDQFWTANTKWHNDFATKFKKDAHTLDPFCPVDLITNTDKVTLKKMAGNTTFKNMKLKYREMQRPTGIQMDNVKEECWDDRKSKVNSYLA